MKAAVYKGNKTFSIIERELMEPHAEEVRIKVAYTGVCGTDVHIYHGMMDKRVAIPETIGHEMSGTIDAVGEKVSDFKIGDKVVVRPLDDRKVKPSDKGFNHICEELKFIGIDSSGSMQQFWNVPAFTLHKLKPETNLRLAALIEPLSVAVHDVRLSGLKAGETAVILGGGPIGLLVALVAKQTGAQVVVSEVNDTRIAKAEELGLTAINPLKMDLVGYVKSITENRKADVVFEVAGVQATLDMMTEVAGIRGRIVMVAIHGQKKEVDLFQFFWKELKLIGVRVYEKEDYEKAIELVTENKLKFEKLITEVRPLSDIQQVFEDIDKQPDGMKILMDCQQ
ncbi:zinc-dependent alcohol dehydrogenase [Euzebyella saccharophila]|uniref:Zinc-binding dehydrogenase n=1 Tax=Euzebyella saccharophila TaxID=679664 RepID=A0ABV8JQS0_9FLAO|nr:alcohol dehydrogenase catalytic domain-containing protein [Euzebyella saccharophila]